MKHYANDPRRITCRFSSTCKSCGKSLAKGAEAFYWPNGKTIKCTDCGESDYAQFLLSAQDEENYNAGYGTNHY